MQYRKARLDEVQEVAQVCADAFEDYPYLSMIASNLKNPEQYKEFVLALQEILVRLAIKRDSCLVAEKDGRIVAAAILQHQTISMLNYLQNGGTKLFRFISITKLFKYFNFVEESERHLEDSAEYDWYLMMLAVTPDYQRKGIGSRFLLEGVEPFVRSTGGHSLGLITNRDYNVPFYEKNGYKQCGYKVLTYETHKLGNWPFVKSLDE